MFVLFAKYRPEPEKLLRNADRWYRPERLVPFLPDPAGVADPGYKSTDVRATAAALLNFLK
jgi:hypothetical protein